MLAWLIAIGCAAWAFGALQFDFPVGKAVTAWGFAAVVVAMIVFLLLLVEGLAWAWKKGVLTWK